MTFRYPVASHRELHLTAGNVDDRQPVGDLVKGLLGKLVGDKGYISQSLFEQLLQEGL